MLPGCGRRRRDRPPPGRSADVHERAEERGRQGLRLLRHQGNRVFVAVLSRGTHNDCSITSPPPKGILNEQGFLSGPSSTEDARFGMAISPIPDLDLDGYSDVVVGAPLEDNRRGVIYIYNGEDKTLKKEFSQVWKASGGCWGASGPWVVFFLAPLMQHRG